MIRQATPQDAPAIAAIYNEYVEHSTVTFETVPVTEGEMRARIEATIAARYPYFVYEAGKDGSVAAYCYAHRWKERAAYGHTWETTVYVSSAHRRQGIGRKLMERMIEESRRRDVRALIACVTGENVASAALHLALGFKQVSRFEAVGLKFGRWLDIMDYELLLPDALHSS